MVNPNLLQKREEEELTTEGNSEDTEDTEEKKRGEGKDRFWVDSRFSMIITIICLKQSFLSSSSPPCNSVYLLFTSVVNILPLLR